MLSLGEKVVLLGFDEGGKGIWNLLLRERLLLLVAWEKSINAKYNYLSHNQNY